MNETTEQSAQTFAGITKDQMGKLRQEHGEDCVKAVTIPLPNGKSVQWIYRAPERMEYERYTETLMKIRDGKVAVALAANRTLVVACTLAPPPETLAATLDAFPMLADKLAEPILKLAGADVEIREETF